MESGRESLILQQTPPMPSETQRPRVEAARTPRWSLNAWLKVRSQLCSPNFLTPHPRLSSVSSTSDHLPLLSQPIPKSCSLSSQGLIAESSLPSLLPLLCPLL